MLIFLLKIWHKYLFYLLIEYLKLFYPAKKPLPFPILQFVRLLVLSFYRFMQIL